jgi:hypothetical protein
MGQIRPTNSAMARIVSQELCQSRLLFTNKEQTISGEQTRDAAHPLVRNGVPCSSGQRQTDIE